MKWALILFCSLWALNYSHGHNNEEVCYNSVMSFCSKPELTPDIKDCNACYGGFSKGPSSAILKEIQKFANSHIAHSFDYLLMASNFGSYMKDRKGFEKLYRHLSDSTWEDGIELIKFITKRGGSMDFNIVTGRSEQPVASLHEIQSLGRAMDIHKKLADHSFEIHGKASETNDHEPEVTSFLEKHFLHQHAEIIRSLAGHIFDVKKMIANMEQKSLSLFLFDEYLQEHSL